MNEPKIPLCTVVVVDGRGRRQCRRAQAPGLSICRKHQRRIDYDARKGGPARRAVDQRVVRAAFEEHERRLRKRVARRSFRGHA